jgi:hypothetical protein
MGGGGVNNKSMPIIIINITPQNISRALLLSKYNPPLEHHITYKTYPLHHTVVSTDRTAEGEQPLIARRVVPSTEHNTIYT